MRGALGESEGEAGANYILILFLDPMTDFISTHESDKPNAPS